MIHSYEVDDAIRYGIIPAVLLYNIKFWVAKNAANDQHFYEGRYWTYNSIKAFGTLFPELTSDQVRRALDKLVTDGAVFVGCFNENKHDRTKWYSVEVCGMRANSICDNTQLDLANLPNVYKETDINTDINTDIKAGKPATSSTRKSKKVTLQQWRESEREAGRKVLPDDDPIWNHGIPDAYINLAWRVFVERCTGDKTQADWRRTFRNYVSNDWLKIWAITRDGRYFLTTAGKQAAIRHNMEELVNG